ASTLVTTPRKKTWPAASTVISTCPLTGGSSNGSRPSIGASFGRVAETAAPVPGLASAGTGLGLTIGGVSTWRRHHGGKLKSGGTKPKNGSSTRPIRGGG